MLRRRLLVIFSIFTILGGVGNLLNVLLYRMLNWWDFQGLGVWGGLVGLLASRRPLSLPVLRTCELIGFGELAWMWARFMFLALHKGNILLFAALPGGLGMTALMAHVSLHWFSLLAIYGIIVPNTWRRAALILGLLALMPLVVAIFVWWRDPPPSGLRFDFLLGLGWWMGLGWTVSVYGSHKLAALRREVALARKLGPYTLIRRLGAGGMGEVHLARHRLLKRPCAIKLIRPDRASNPEVLQRFEREVEAATRLTHPAVVQLYDYGRDPDGTFYYVMEYLPGLTLEEMVRRGGPFPPGRVVFILRQVCGALAEAHALGLVHRDIKPANVMVCQHGGRADATKVLDFGLVKEINSADPRLTQEGGILGTPHYLSPEQARGGEVSPASDLYAVGATAYFLLTGRPPFEGGNILGLLHAHQATEPDPPSRVQAGVPADLEAVVMRLLAKDPARRYSSAAALETVLAGCASGEPWTDANASEWWARVASTLETPNWTPPLTGRT